MHNQRARPGSVLEPVVFSIEHAGHLVLPSDLVLGVVHILDESLGQAVVKNLRRPAILHYAALMLGFLFGMSALVFYIRTASTGEWGVSAAGLIGLGVVAAVAAVVVGLVARITIGITAMWATLGALVASVVEFVQGSPGTGLALLGHALLFFGLQHLLARLSIGCGTGLNPDKSRLVLGLQHLLARLSIGCGTLLNPGKARQSQASIWSDGVPNLRPSEERVNASHLALSEGDGLTPTTVFLTTQRLVIRRFNKTGGYRPEGVSFDLKDLRKVVPFHPLSAGDSFHFTIWFQWDMDEAPLFFGPRNQGVSALLARRLRDDIAARIAEDPARTPSTDES